MSEKPTFVLIAGAWHGPDAWDTFRPLLASKTGSPTSAVALPSVFGDLPTWKHGDDALAIRQAISRELEKGRDVVTVSHSYAGIPTAEAVEGLLRKDREGKAAVVGMVYLASFARPEGVALRNGDPNHERKSDSFWMPAPENSAHLLYNEVKPQSEVDRLMTVLAPRRHATDSFTAPVRYAGYLHSPSFYLICTHDNAIPPAEQERMAKEGMFGVVRRVQADHTPWVSRPEETAEFLEEVVETLAGR